MDPDYLPKKKISFRLKWIVPAVIVAAFLVYFLFARGKARQILKPFLSSGSDSDGFFIDGARVVDPLTGVECPETEALVWKGTRPLAVMVNNHISARPQAGLSQADIVYEIVAEGGITRFLAFFLSQSPEKAGPIRSTREYYLVLVKELGDAMIMHIGWSPQALQAIEAWPVRSLGRLGLNCEQILADPKGEKCWRNLKRVEGGVAWEHTAFGNIKELKKAGEDAGWGGTKDIKIWQFKDDSPEVSANGCAAAECIPLTIDFWYKGDYTAGFKYDKGSNAYLRFNGYAEDGSLIPSKDDNIGEQVKIKNVIVQFVPEAPIAGDEKNRLTYQLEGSGQALVFIDGKVIKTTWSKAGRDQRTFFYDMDGNEVAFNRGNFWLSMVSDKNVDQVKY